MRIAISPGKMLLFHQSPALIIITKRNIYTKKNTSVITDFPLNFNLANAYPPSIPKNTTIAEVVREIYILFLKYFKNGNIPGLKISSICLKVNDFGIIVGGKPIVSAVDLKATLTIIINGNNIIKSMIIKAV